jgi:hypothetical protein
VTPHTEPSSLTSSAARFADVARRYCEYVDNAARLDEKPRAEQARIHLAELVQVASQLPQGKADGPDPEDVSMPATWQGFGELDAYVTVFDPYVEDAPVTGLLSDDLLDVYRDLRRGLQLYDAGHIEVAVWEWKFHFDHHWGNHAVDALRALQRVCLRLSDPAPAPDSER